MRWPPIECCLHRCLGLVVRLDEVVAPDALDQARHLMVHGEPGTAIAYLAIGITQKSPWVAAEVIPNLRDRAWEPTDLPPNLDDFIAR